LSQRENDVKKIDISSLDLQERVVHINRVAKVVKGGRRFKFLATVVVGDVNSHIGIGFGKAGEISEAIRKATESARKEIREVACLGTTIPYAVKGRCGASIVLLKPASEGTGVIACDAVRAVLELAGLKDVLTKSLGSNRALNLVKATMNGLEQLQSPEEIAAKRDKNLSEIRSFCIQSKSNVLQ
jgi:small subunit ribosomal protein S5